MELGGTSSAVAADSSSVRHRRSRIDLRGALFCAATSFYFHSPTSLVLGVADGAVSGAVGLSARHRVSGVLLPAVPNSLSK